MDNRLHETHHVQGGGQSVSPVGHALSDPLPGRALIAARPAAPRRRDVLAAADAARAGRASRPARPAGPGAARAARVVALLLLALAGQGVPQGAKSVLKW